MLRRQTSSMAMIHDAKIQNSISSLIILNHYKNKIVDINYLHYMYTRVYVGGKVTHGLELFACIALTVCF